MWNESSVGGGGGFLDESTQGGGAGRKGPQTNDKSIVPLLIKHIANATGDLQIGGKTINTVTIVGIVRRIEQDTTKISYTIQDDTGVVTAVMWLEADRNPTESNIQMNTYVRIYGLLRNQNNQRQLLILRMHPLAALNELTYHILEVMHFILSTNKPTEEFNSANRAVMSDNTMGGMSSEQVTVLEIIRSANDAECGIEKCDILSRVPKHVVSRLDEILDFLMCEGHIYTTSSEDFFKAT